MSRFNFGPVIDAETIVGFYPRRQTDISTQRLLEVMDSHGVNRAAIVSARGIFYDDVCGNTETLQWCRSAPLDAEGKSRFLPVATLDLRKFTGYRAEINRMAAEGVRLWRLFPDFQGWEVDLAPFRRVAAALGEAGAVLMINAQPSRVMRALADVRLSVILCTHFYQMPDLLALLEEGAEFYLSTRLMHGPGALERMVREMGVERLIFGSGAPLAAQGSAVRRMLNAAVTPAERAAMCGSNLLQLLGEAPNDR